MGYSLWGCKESDTTEYHYVESEIYKRYQVVEHRSQSSEKISGQKRYFGGISLVTEDLVYMDFPIQGET